MRYASRQRAPSAMWWAATLLFATVGFTNSLGADTAAGLYVICHPSVAIAVTDLRDIFLGEKQFAGSVRLAPVDNSAARAAFLEKVLRMDFSKYLTAWTKKSFRDGVTPPAVSASDAEAIEYVRRAPGGCSYITTVPGPGVFIVAEF